LYANNVIHVARREPRVPPAQRLGEEADEAPQLSWFTGITMTLLLPLVILLVAHGLVDIPLRHREGAVIFLFFAWVTSSQAMLSLFRLRGVTSWQVAGVMIVMLGLVVLTYLWVGDRFTDFLYPAQGEAERYFHAAALPRWLFDFMVVLVTGLIVAGWIILYRNIPAQSHLTSAWANVVHPRVYVWFWNRLYVDKFYVKAGDAIVRLARRVDASLPEWLP
ncbi:MAG: NADH-quinone oxidoreductase subunit L, partial [bacterium]